MMCRVKVDCEARKKTSTALCTHREYEAEEQEEESVYTGSDYIEGAASRLRQIGEMQAASDIAACYCEADTSVENMDPLDILILLEEGAERHKHD